VFANRYTALIDACVLARVLPRNLLLTLAEAGFFRVRWSGPVLDETGRTIAKLLRAQSSSQADAEAMATEQVRRMTVAFEEAMVTDFDMHLAASSVLPDPNDAHVLAAAVKAQAAAIVTDNLKDFPPAALATFGLEARSADDFIADTIALDEGRAVAALRDMRQRFRKPDLSAEQLLVKMEAAGLLASADTLRPHVGSL
jgi:predicted nucleic acid-binding protein